MDNRQVNEKELFDVTGEILELINEIYLELDELKGKGDKIIISCQELKSFDGRRVVDVSNLSFDQNKLSNEWKKCYIFGEEEVEKDTKLVQDRLMFISDVMDSIYKKVKSSRESSEVIEEHIHSISDALVGGTETVIAKSYVDTFDTNRNIDFQTTVTQEQFEDAVKTNFEQNRALTTQMSQEVYKSVYEEVQKMLSNSGGDSL